MPKVRTYVKHRDYGMRLLAPENTRQNDAFTFKLRLQKKDYRYLQKTKASQHDIV